MDDKLTQAWEQLAEAAGREEQLRARALKTAVQALHQIATAQSGQGLRDTANTALQAIAVTLAS